MSTTDATSESAAASAPPKPGEMRLEAIPLPVSDIDRAKAFYEGLGWRLDADLVFGEDVRVVQFTPPGSGCSIHFGKGLTTAEPGSAQRLEMAVYDIDAAREDLISHGVEVSEPFHSDDEGIAPGPDPQRSSYKPTRRSTIQTATAFCSRRSPSACRDGDGRKRSGGSIMDVETLTALLREAEEHHGEYEPTAPKHHWSTWYAAYIAARDEGKIPEEAVGAATLHTEGPHG